MLTERELRIAAMAIITFANVMETGALPEVDDEGFIEAGAFIDGDVFEAVLQFISDCDIDALDLFEEDTDDR